MVRLDLLKKPSLRSGRFEPYHFDRFDGVIDVCQLDDDFLKYSDDEVTLHVLEQHDRSNHVKINRLIYEYSRVPGYG